MKTASHSEAALEETMESITPSQANVHPALRRIVLTGFMGSGKTTLGRLIAARLGWNFLDLDHYIESRTGLSVPDIFALHGEPHFRRLESTALVSALGKSNTVIALGGGTPEILTNRLLLEQTPATATIFLDAPFSVLFDRCVLQGISRPVLADPTLAELRFAQRQPVYRALAHHTIDTSAIEANEAVEAMVIALTIAPKRTR
ncbi:shikimate kinase [Granulicella aggregans]|uniref:Shikimate kinase n=1 Tax=Granulicella aggregans TaxID=474949 RepID=A0A7W7Z9C1_9BACT|nr:shikimate kinase [Granulicella aggregans]MBB5055675.1 shikimate kinase [Granulicella aggregans]